MKDNQYTELIDAYLLEQLSNEEMEKFNSLLTEDSEFKGRVDDACAAFELIKIEGKEEIRTELKKIHEGMNNSNSKTSIPFILKFAAIFIGIFTIGALIWYSMSPQYNYGRLYADNFEPYTNLLTIKGETTVTDEQSLINNAMYQYDLHDYEKANLSFQRLLEIKKNNDTVLFYYGISKLGSGDSKNAISLLSKLEENEESLFSRFGHVKWYLALAYLKHIDEISQEDNISASDIDYYLEKCKNLLTDIIKDKGDYSDEAQKILKGLD